MVLGRGGLLGPDLSNIGAERRLAELHRPFYANPSRMSRGYQPVRLTTKSGDKVDGVVKNGATFPYR